MRIHHLNCISTCPLGGKLMDGRTPSIVQRGHLACHCLLVESRSGLVLIDTGLGMRDVADPRGRLSGFFLAMLRPEWREEMTAVGQLRHLGFRPEDVRHIVLTHLDFDHAGGLDDFPHAVVHMLAAESDYALLQKTWLDRQRFRPQQWSTRDKWKMYSMHKGDAWFGFDSVRSLEGLDDDIAMIPLIGHTYGHAGVAVNRGDKWLLQAGDAYFYRHELDATSPHCTPGLRFYQWMMDKDRPQRRHNQERLRELKQAHAASVEVFCGHDIVEFEWLAGRSARIPAEHLSRVA
ncbi:MBL fold metallo-hydrolase [Pollutimonas thiosulfatoxidans]|uniref:MBL fold metallo-hydrolase n=1 Tax=Pollutimonas thiosulfatoxidans TaxID=2028345 RepID=A0A410GAT0_9BURK|nr:MBL fold metallo-hydrolase [Pollutimonas thiosulfatoxidans]QAA93397.1 MBL fold metallo-hydrolase [Pollutimonas thiosulfatoxidans]